MKFMFAPNAKVIVDDPPSKPWWITMDKDGLITEFHVQPALEAKAKQALKREQDTRSKK